MNSKNYKNKFLKMKTKKFNYKKKMNNQKKTLMIIKKRLMNLESIFKTKLMKMKSLLND